MKKVILLTLLLLTIIFSVLFTIKFERNLIENIHLITIIILVIFGFIFIYSRLRSINDKEPIDDEYTKKLIQKTSSISFYVSLYLWVIILIIKDRFHMDLELWIGTGILSMSITFMVVFFVLKLKGILND